MSDSIADRVRVRIAPGAGGERSVRPPFAAEAPDPLVAATRDELGIGAWAGVATGHQPIFWHGGILAKAMCAATLSRAAGLGWMHLIADHDTVDPCAVPYPAQRDSDGVRRAVAHFGPPVAAGTAASCVLASAVRTAEEACSAPPASADIAERLGRIASALAASDASRGAAWRTVDANFALLSAMGALERPTHIVRVSTLLRTPLGRACVERIAADPEACARAFNDALAHAPRAASRLRVDGDASEVPLWEAGQRGERLRITGQRLQELIRDGALSAQRAEATSSGAASQASAGWRILLPRAFLATGIIRALGIHLVHGTGGEAYERAGDAWWRTALGRALPPFSVTTADLRFRPESLGIRTDAVPTRLSWRDAWVDPARLDGVARDPSRAQAVAAIASMPRRSAERRRAFEAMRDRVESLRVQRSAELDALASADAAQRGARASLDAAADRTYPAVLHCADALAGLATLVAGAVSASAEASGASGSRR
jgi:hypothetical protein